MCQTNAMFKFAITLKSRKRIKPVIRYVAGYELWQMEKLPYNCSHKLYRSMYSVGYTCILLSDPCVEFGSRMTNLFSRKLWKSVCLTYACTYSHTRVYTNAHTHTHTRTHTHTHTRTRTHVRICAHSHSGADVEEESLDGRTPLHEASVAGHVSIAELLVREGGANPVPRDENDATPYDLAFSNGHKQVSRECVLQSAVISFFVAKETCACKQSGPVRCGCPVCQFVHMSVQPSARARVIVSSPFNGNCAVVGINAPGLS